MYLIHKFSPALEIWNVKFRYKDSTAYVNAKGDYKLNRSIKNMRLGKLRETSWRCTSFIIRLGPQTNMADDRLQSERSLLSLCWSKRPFSPLNSESRVRTWKMRSPLNWSSRLWNSSWKMICLRVWLLHISVILRWSLQSVIYRNILNIGVMPIPPAIIMISIFPESCKWLNNPNGPFSKTRSPAWRFFNSGVQSPVVRTTNWRQEVLVGVEVKEKGCSSLEIWFEKKVKKPNWPGR